MSEPHDHEGDPALRRAALGRRAIRFEQLIADRTGTEITRLPYGVSRFCPDIPRYRGWNHVEVTRPVAVSELLADIDPRFERHGLRHRRITTTVPEVAWVLAPSLSDRGWEPERLVYMAHDGRTASPVSPLGVGPAGPEPWERHTRAVVASEPWGQDAAVQDDFVARDRRLAERIDVTWIMSDGGAAGCHVYRHGAVAQIENVNVLPEARGQGLGQAVMAAALRACHGTALVFLVADADDWPQRWYARLGFEPVASGWGWTRRPDGAGPQT